MAETIQHEGLIPLSYNYTKSVDILDVSELDWTEIAVLDIKNLLFGAYEFKMAMNYQYDVANQSFQFRWRANGGEWTEITSEPKDKTDRILASYFYPIENVEGDYKMEFQAKKESATGTLDIFFFDAIVQRVA